MPPNKKMALEEKVVAVFSKKLGLFSLSANHFLTELIPQMNSSDV